MHNAIWTIASGKPFKRSIVERTIGWLNRRCRLAKDWECPEGSRLTLTAGAASVVAAPKPKMPAAPYLQQRF